MNRETIQALRQAADMQGLSMEFSELLADAERYQWLRDSGIAEVYLPTTLNASGWANLAGCSSVEKMDGAVDAAMSKDDTALRNLNAASEAMGEEL